MLEFAYVMLLKDNLLKAMSVKYSQITLLMTSLVMLLEASFVSWLMSTGRKETLILIYKMCESVHKVIS